MDDKSIETTINSPSSRYWYVSAVCSKWNNAAPVSFVVELPANTNPDKIFSEVNHKVYKKLGNNMMAMLSMFEISEYDYHSVYGTLCRL